MSVLASLITQVTDTSDGTSSSTSAGIAAGVLIVYMIIVFAVLVLMVASMWRLFTKAGQPGWAAIIPILNLIVLWKLLKVEVMWIIFAFVPCLNIVWAIAAPFFIARAYGKSAGYGVGILLVPVIFLPMLAFGKAQYQSEPDPLF